MTNSQRLNPIPPRAWLYLAQVLVIVGVLAAIWFVDPLGWHKEAPQVAPAPDVTGTTLDQIQNLQAQLKADPTNTDGQIELATLYLQYVRETADPSYYNKADDLLKQAYATDPNNIFTLTQMGTLALARHEFQDALSWGKRAVAVNDKHWLAYGIIGDANVELGNYEDARAAFDKMVSLRPDVNSYTRISYMRELLGDRDGAIKAMTMAMRIGAQNTESSNWARVQLGNLYFNGGQLDQAEILYNSSLQLYPNYIHALAGMGKVRAARGDYAGAIQYYQQALRAVPFPEYVIALGDVYAASGDQANAQKQYALVGAIQQLYTANGVDTDLEIDLFNADHNIDLNSTLQQARAAYTRRPSIYGADVLAWVLYKTGNYGEAQTYTDKALSLGMQDALKYYHAGMIALKLNQPDRARDDLQKALKINPYFSILYSAQAKQTLKQLQ